MSSERGASAEASVTVVAALPRDLPTLTSLRTFAALWVLVFHLGLFGILAVPGWEMGFTGVGFFFALSGFVLTWSTKTGTSARHFYRRRFARIYPTYFVVLLAAVASKILVGSTVSWFVFSTHIFLIQAWSANNDVVYGLNGVAWSLSCEAAFYAAFPLLIWVFRAADRRLRWLIPTVSLLLVGALSATVPGWDGFLYHFPLARMSEFVLGIVAAMAVMEGWRPRWRTWQASAVVVALLTLMNVASAGSAIIDTLVAVPFMALIVAAVTNDIDGRTRILGRPALVYCGQVSFAFYLVHQMVIVTLSRTNLTGPLAASMDLVLAFTIAVCLHHLIEKPLQRLLGRSGGIRRPFKPARNQIS